MEPFCYLCFVSVMLSCLFIAALWLPAGKGLASGLSRIRYVSCVFCHFPMWCPGSGVVLIVSIPDMCRLPFLQTR